MFEGRLMYDSGTDRYQIIDSVGEVLHPGLHCGDCFAVMMPDGWEDTRIEFDQRGWYLVGLSFVGQLNNLFVRYGR